MHASSWFVSPRSSRLCGGQILRFLFFYSSFLAFAYGLADLVGGVFLSVLAVILGKEKLRAKFGNNHCSQTTE